MFGKELENCMMSSLKEICELTNRILEKVEINKLEEIDIKTAKKILKLKQKQLIKFIKSYNDAIKVHNLTYFSMILDNKFIILTVSNGKYYGNVSEISKEIRNKKSLCYFCNSFRDGNEIIFATNTLKKSNGEYSSIGQYCCSNYQKCNKEIIDINNLIEFLTYKK